MGIPFEKYVAAVVQTASVFLSHKATVEKAWRFIRKAGKEEARLVVFNEITR